MILPIQCAPANSRHAGQFNSSGLLTRASRWPIGQAKEMLALEPSTHWFKQPMVKE